MKIKLSAKELYPKNYLNLQNLMKKSIKKNYLMFNVHIKYKYELLYIYTVQFDVFIRKKINKFIPVK